MIQQKIQENIIAALKAKETKALSVLRFLQSAIKNKEIEKKAALTDEEVIQVIRKQIKELDDAKLLFEKGGRADLEADNGAQIKILQTYLPAEISDEELQHVIDKLLAENKALYEKNPKAIIGTCMSALKSKASPQRIMNYLNLHLIQN